MGVSIMEKTYVVEGMTCVICKNNVEKTLNKIEGVNSAIVSLMDNEVLIDFNENKVNEKIMHDFLKQEGYELVINSKRKYSSSFIKLLISIVLTIFLMIISMSNMHNAELSKYYQLVLASIIILININYYKSGFKSLFMGRPNMDTLVSISSFISYLYSLYALFNHDKYNLYFETSAMVLVIVSLGKYLEEKNKRKTTKFIRGLSTLIPMQANLLIDNQVKIVPIEEIKKGDHILIEPGQSIPQDGIVISGSSNVDESLITGESGSNLKTINSQVIGGTINIDGQLIIEVNKVSTQTTLSKIVSLAKQATLNKIPIERFADKISYYFVYGILAISLITFIVWMIINKDIELAMNFALSVLVISCPCALGLATPSAIAVACNTATKNNLLIKNPEILEIAHKIKNVILDKTGTITQNKLSVVESIAYDDSFEKVLSSLEKNSNHPIGKAIKELYTSDAISFDEITQISGEGILGKLGNDEYFAGNETMLNKHGIKLDEQLTFGKENNYSYIGVGKNSQLLGIVYLSDKIKQSSIQAINNLNNKSINLVIATGDNETTTSIIAKILKINNYYAAIKPEDKKTIVEKYKKEAVTAMVGDGINDAIALSSADVSISLNDGTDIANAASDVTLLTNDLKGISFLINLSKKTMHIIKQNLFWALLYNAIFIPVAAGCLYKLGIVLNPMIGSITMSISSLFVISNALRIKNIKGENK